MKKFISRLPFYTLFGEIVSTSTFKQSAITFIGTVATGALGAVFYILAARFLGPSNFGLLSIALATLTLVSDIGDLGTDTGLVNFVSRHIEDEPKKAWKFLKLGFEVKLIVWVFVVIVGYLTSDFIADVIFTKPEVAGALKITFLGVGAVLFFSFITHVLQALQRFWAWSLVQVATNILRVLMIFGLIYYGALSIENTMWLYISMPVLGFLIGIYLIKPKFLKVKGEWEISKEFFKYNKWVAAFTLLAAFGSRIDTFISARLLSADTLGVYSAANQLVRIVPLIVVALGTVIAPKMAKVGSLDELVSYLKKTQVMVFGLAFLGIMAIPLVLWLITPIFGPEYTSAGPIFIVLLFAMLIFLISVPVHTAVFYYFSYPKLFFWLSLVHLTITAVLGWVLISSIGVMGAAVSVLVGQAVNFIIPLLWVVRKIRSAPVLQ